MTDPDPKDDDKWAQNLFSEEQRAELAEHNAWYKKRKKGGELDRLLWFVEPLYKGRLASMARSGANDPTNRRCQECMRRFLAWNLPEFLTETGEFRGDATHLLWFGEDPQRLEILAELRRTWTTSEHQERNSPKTARKHVFEEIKRRAAAEKAKIEAEEKARADALSKVAQEKAEREAKEQAKRRDEEWGKRAREDYAAHEAERAQRYAELDERAKRRAAAHPETAQARHEESDYAQRNRLAGDDIEAEIPPEKEPEPEPEAEVGADADIEALIRARLLDGEWRSIERMRDTLDPDGSLGLSETAVADGFDGVRCGTSVRVERRQGAKAWQYRMIRQTATIDFQEVRRQIAPIIKSFIDMGRRPVSHHTGSEMTSAAGTLTKLLRKWER